MAGSYPAPRSPPPSCAPGCRVIGAEPTGADDAYRSLQAGRILPSVDPRTIADGLHTSLGELTFPVIRERVESIVTVSEQAIVAAMRLVWERMKIIIEPSSAVPVAALLEKRDQVGGKKIGVILSGGNVDLANALALMAAPAAATATA